MLKESVEKRERRSPQISVIIPVYKAEEHIARCVESVLAQSFTDFELILVDDGSPDRCPEMCDTYALMDKRVKVVHKDNAGVSSARNAGLEYAQGEYITFIDSDDYVLDDYLEKIYIQGTDLCICGYKLVDSKDNVLEVKTIPDKHYSKKKYIDYETLYRTNVMYSSWGKIFRRDIITEKNLLFDTNLWIGEDTLFVIEYLRFVDSIVLINYTGYIYNSYETNNTLSSPLKIDIIENLVRAREQTVEIAKQFCSKVVNIIDENTMSNIAWYMERLLLSNMSFEKKEKILQYYLENSYVKRTINDAEIYYKHPKVRSCISFKSAKSILNKYERLCKYEKIVHKKNRLYRKIKVFMSGIKDKQS